MRRRSVPLFAFAMAVVSGNALSASSIGLGRRHSTHIDRAGGRLVTLVSTALGGKSLSYLKPMSQS
jgi:hypothetical protein